MTSLADFLLLGSLLLGVGLYGLMTRRNLIRVLISLEIMLNGVNVMVASFASYTGSVDGVVFALFIIALGAVETAVGIGIMVALYFKFNTIDLDEFTRRRW